MSGSCDGAICVWDRVSGTEVYAITEVHELAIRSVAFSPDGRRFVSGSDDHTIRIQDMSRSTILGLLQGHEGRVTSVAFSPDVTRILSR